MTRPARRSLRRGALASALVASVLLSAPGGAAAAQPSAGSESARLLASFVGEDAASLREEHGLTVRRRLPLTGTEVLTVPPGRDPEAVAARLRNHPAVRFAEVDRRITLAASDPGFPQLWGLHNTGQTVAGRAGTDDVDVDAPEAWAITHGIAETIVAVVDTGVDIGHPDLAPRIWRNPGEIPGNGVDDDRNGLVDDVNGWDFANDDASVYDSAADWHGTHVAGTVAATLDGRGVVGVAPAVSVLPLKFIGADGWGQLSDAVAAVEYAGQAGARIINASWGYVGPPSAALEAAMSATGAVVVAAAGNEGVDNDLIPSHPANSTLPTVLSVTSVDNTGGVPPFANTGLTTVDVGAPGVDILSTYPGGQFVYASGTSMAAPHAAGVAALVASYAPSITAKEIVGHVAAHGQALDSLAGRTVTGRMMNAGAALTALRAPSAPRAVSATPSSGSVQLDWQPPADDGGTAIRGYTVTVTPGGQQLTLAAATTSTRIAGLTNGVTYRLAVAATNAVGTGATAETTAVPATVADAPRQVAATAGGTTATVTWAAPASNGGSPVTGYAVRATPGGATVTVGAAAMSAQVGGLATGTTYSFTVAATNAMGTGPAATSPAVFTHRPGSFDGDPATTERVDAPDPVSVGVRASRARFSAGGAGYAVVSRHDVFADALAGAPLSAEGPLLLTPSGHLDRGVAEELRRTVPAGSVVYLLGGPAALGPAVEDALRGIGYRPHRLAGRSRVETGVAVAEEVRRRWPGTSTVALARAHGTATDPSAAWADSVTGGAWAARQRVPIVVTDRDALHPAVADALRRWQPTRTVLLGGVAALSDAVQAAVPAPQRVAGPSRVETAAAIATQLWGSTSPRRYVVMHGYRPDGWAYGLSAAGLAADTAAPVLLIDDHPQVHPAVRPLVGSCGLPAVDLVVVGGTSVLGESTVAALDAADGNTC